MIDRRAVTTSATPGEFTGAERIDVAMQFWHIEQASGIVTLKMRSSADKFEAEMNRVAGNHGKLQDITSFQLCSDVASDEIVIEFSDQPFNDIPGVRGFGSVMSVAPTTPEFITATTYNFTMTAGGYGTSQIAPAGAKVRRITFCLDANAPGGVVIMSTSGPANLFPGLPLVCTTAQDTGGTPTCDHYNPNAVPVAVAVTVEYDT